MFTLFKPSPAQVADFLAAQQELPFSYKEVGATKGVLPPGYPTDHHRVPLGHGEKTFAAAKKAIADWKMYSLGWTRLYPAQAPVTVGGVVCVVVNHVFCWSLNSCRILYLREGAEGVERFGFAFGTLPGHSEEGEERFTVEWRREDDSVWYEVLAFARPHHLFAKIGFPLVRLTQRRFFKESQEAMRKAIRENLFPV